MMTLEESQRLTAGVIELHNLLAKVAYQYCKDNDQPESVGHVATLMLADGLRRIMSPKVKASAEMLAMTIAVLHPRMSRSEGQDYLDKMVADIGDGNEHS